MWLISFEILEWAELIFLIDFFLIGLFDDGLYFHIPRIFGTFFCFIVLDKFVVDLGVH